MKDPNVKIYQEYTRWLGSLPQAHEVGTYREKWSMCIESLFKIEGREGLFVIGCTGDETKHSIIASLAQGNLLKARVFEPK